MLVNKVSVVLDDTFTIKSPIWDYHSVGSGRYPNTVKATEMFFGAKKGKAHLCEPVSGKKKNLKITDWNMTPSTGVSILMFQVSKPSKSFPASSSYLLKVANKIWATKASTEFMLIEWTEPPVETVS